MAKSSVWSVADVDHLSNPSPQYHEDPSELGWASLFYTQDAISSDRLREDTQRAVCGRADATSGGLINIFRARKEAVRLNLFPPLTLAGDAWRLQPLQDVSVSREFRAAFVNLWSGTQIFGVELVSSWEGAKGLDDLGFGYTTRTATFDIPEMPAGTYLTFYSTTLSPATGTGPQRIIDYAYRFKTRMAIRGYALRESLLANNEDYPSIGSDGGFGGDVRLSAEGIRTLQSPGARLWFETVLEKPVPTNNPPNRVGIQVVRSSARVWIREELISSTDIDNQGDSQALVDRIEKFRFLLKQLPSWTPYVGDVIRYRNQYWDIVEADREPSVGGLYGVEAVAVRIRVAPDALFN